MHAYNKREAISKIKLPPDVLFEVQLAFRERLDRLHQARQLASKVENGDPEYWDNVIAVCQNALSRFE